MPAQSTMTSPQQLVEIAKAPLVAYNDKKWDAVKNTITSDFVYDEIATRRKAQGADQTLELWRGWAAAFPDSRATFHGAFASGSTVTFEVTWNGTHQGALQTPAGSIAPTGQRIEIRACCVVEVAGDKAKVQRHYFDMLTLLEQLGVKG